MNRRGAILTTLMALTFGLLVLSALAPMLIKPNLLSKNAKAAEDPCRSVIYSVSFNTQSFVCTIVATTDKDIACGIKTDSNAFPDTCIWTSGLQFQCPKDKFQGASKVFIGGLYHKQGTSCFNDWTGSAKWQEYTISSSTQPPPSQIPVVSNNPCDTKSIYNACTNAPKHANGCAFNDGAQTASARGWYYCGRDDYWRGPYTDEAQCAACPKPTVQTPPVTVPPIQAPVIIPSVIPPPAEQAPVVIPSVVQQPPAIVAPVITCETKSPFNNCTSAPKEADGCTFNDGGTKASDRGWYFCGIDDYWRGPYVERSQCTACPKPVVQAAAPIQAPAAAPEVPQAAVPQPAAQTLPDKPPAQNAPPTPTTVQAPPLITAATISSGDLAKINFLTGIAGSKKIIVITHKSGYTEWKNQGYGGASNPGKILDVLTSDSNSIVKHMFDNGFWATAHEDMAETRNFTDCYPNCQFWRMEDLTNNGAIQTVFNHESIHNMQSTHDNHLAEHLNFGSRADIDKAYQSIIEGSATAIAGGGMPYYSTYVLYYKTMQDWSNTHNLSTQFQAAANGDWNAFNIIIKSYEGKDGTTSTHILLLTDGVL